MANTFYVRKGAKKFGPFDSGQLKKLAATGKISRDSVVSADGETKWTPAGNIKGLFPPGELIVDAKPAAIPTIVRSAAPSIAQPAAAPPTIVYVQQAGPQVAPQQIVQQTTVVVHASRQGNTIAQVSVALAILCLLVCWVPFLGMLIFPLAGLAILLAAIGLLVSLMRKGAGLFTSIAGGCLAVLSIVAAIVSTAGTTAAVTGAAARAIDAANAASAAHDENAKASANNPD